jgi:hypothetical protein
MKSITNPITVIEPTKVKNNPIRSWLFDKASTPAYNIETTQTKASTNTNDFFIRSRVYYNNTKVG